MFRNPRRLTYLNFAVIAYFLLLWIYHKLEVNAWIFSFLTELLTIPAIVGLLVLLILSGRALYRGARSSGLVISFAGLLVLAGFIVASFLR